MMPYTQSLTGRLKSQSEYYNFPVVDCPVCKEVDMPYGVFPTFNGIEYITYWWCLNCKYSTLERPEVKGYVALVDVEECGWETEL